MAKRKSITKKSAASLIGHFADVSTLPCMSIGQRATLAITLEASSRKLGNVHPEARFVDMKYEDFLRSAIAIAPAFDRRGKQTVGKLILDSVAATQHSVGINTNLGTLLLMAPMAIACKNLFKTISPDTEPAKILAALRDRTEAVIERLTLDDSRNVYAAIRLAAPGGMGKTKKLDVHQADAPPQLLDAMRVVEEIDQVAKTYCTRFHFLFDEVVPELHRAIEQLGDISTAVRLFQIRWLARYGDSLVRRKLGEAENDALRAKSKRLLQIFEAEDQQMTVRFEKNWTALDRWMRETDHRRNPGTTADLIAAGLFVLLCCER
jgi:triphosphoribosyl-dephospho-CoA synthase